MIDAIRNLLGLNDGKPGLERRGKELPLSSTYYVEVVCGDRRIGACGTQGAMLSFLREHTGQGHNSDVFEAPAVFLKAIGRRVNRGNGGNGRH